MSEILKLCVLYWRVSTEDQDLSPDVQQRKLRQWAELYGMEIDSIHYDDGKSGKDITHRPGVRAAVDRAVEIKAALVVCKLDRLSRNLDDLRAISRRLDDSGASLVSLAEQVDTKSASGRLFFSLMGLFAEFERERISERTAEALAELKRRGKVAGQVPYGYTRNGNDLIPCEDEQAVIRRIVAMRRAGSGYRAIARVLNEDGIRTKSGRQWFAQSVKQVAERAEVANVNS